MKQIGTKINLIVVFILFFTGFGFSQVPDFSLNKSYGGLLKEFGNALTTDAKGNIFMTGEFFSSSVNFGNGAVLTGAGNT